MKLKVTLSAGEQFVSVLLPIDPSYMQVTPDKKLSIDFDELSNEVMSRFEFFIQTDMEYYLIAKSPFGEFKIPISETLAIQCEETGKFELIDEVHQFIQEQIQLHNVEVVHDELTD